MEDMKTFECAICGKLHNTVKQRIICETDCLKAQEELEKASKEVEKKKDEERINKAIDKLFDDYKKIEKDIEKFFEKYGHRTTVGTKPVNTIFDLINHIF